MLDQHRPDNQFDLAFILIPLYQDTTKAIEWPHARQVLLPLNKAVV